MNTSTHTPVDPTEVNERKHGRLEHIDSLRGIAALMVVVSHAFHWATFNALNLNLGKIGVFVFFLISGFVIPFSFSNNTNPYKRFLVSRFFRLYPAYWFSIALACTVMLISGEVLPPWHVIIANITMFQMGMGAPNLIEVYWTLFIELIFYCTCIALFSMRILNNPNRMIRVFFLLCALSVMASALRFFLQMKLPVAIPLGLTLMYFGCCWRFAIINRDPTASSAMPVMSSILIIVMVAASYLSYSWDTTIAESWKSYAVAYVTAFMVFAIFTSRIKIQLRWTVFLGSISYSLYLVHHPIIFSFQTLSHRSVWEDSAVLMLIAIFASISVSYLIFKLIEKPSIKLGKML